MASDTRGSAVLARSLLGIIQVLSAALPFHAQRACARAFGEIQFRISPDRRAAVLGNLEQIAAAGHAGLADPRARVRAARKMFESQYRGWLEYLGRVAPRALSRGSEYRVIGAEHLYRAAARGRGAVLAIPHLGNWEFVGIALARLGFRIHAVAGIQLHPILTREVRALKEREGIHITTPQEGYGPLITALREGGIVALLVDGDVYSRSLSTTFFRRHTPFPAGPAILARRAGVPILHCHAVRCETGRHYFTIDGLDAPDLSLTLQEDLSRMTAGVARVLERSIATNVTQWCIFRPFWSADAA